MKKNLIGAVITAAVLSLVMWIGSIVFLFSYFEWSFLIGVVLSGLVYFFTSSGGLFSKATNYSTSHSYWKVQQDYEWKANAGFVFYGLLLFTVISLAGRIITYQF